MSDDFGNLRELYQEVIFEHNRNPRNFRYLADATHQAVGHNPLCGDQLTIYLKVNDDQLIEDVSFIGQGCAISKASASLMTERSEERRVGKEWGKRRDGVERGA